MTGSTLEGCTALVTGGGTGIGYGCALRLAEAGASVTLAARRSEVLEEAAERLAAAVPGCNVRSQQCDITVEDDVAAAVEAASNASGQLDIAVANAGSGFPGPIMGLGADHWRYVTDLNILGTALTIKHAGLAMREHGGSIVAISSVNSYALAKHMAPYCVTKAGLEAMVRCAAIELAPFGIRVNAVAPGYVPTEGTAMAFTDAEEQALVDATPLGRAGLPEDVGDAVAYFSAPGASWVTGQTLTVDGGLAIHVIEDFERISRGIHGDELMDACVKPGRD